MPGIAAILTAHASPAHESALLRMQAALREPVDSEQGCLSAPELGVLAAWTAPSGSVAARVSTSPFGRRDPRLDIALSGELFGPDADIENTLADRLASEGDEVVSRLNGLFAGLVVDRRRRRAWLFNDRFGSERLYTYETEDAVYVASKARALLCVHPELRVFDDIGVAHFLTFGSMLAGQTLFRGVRHLNGANLWKIKAPGVIERSSYFTAAQWEALPALPVEEYEHRFDETFRQAVRDLLHDADRVGLSLTGGLDTRMILAALPRSNSPAVAYTYALASGDRLLDCTIARSASRLVGLQHRIICLDEDFLRDFPRQLDRTVRATDGCAGVTGAHEIWLSERARELAPLRLTGNYGSEILRSMSTFKRVGPDDSLLSRETAIQVATVLAEFADRPSHPITHAAFAEVPWHLHGALAAARTQVGVRTPYLDNRVVELAYRAPGSVRTGSAAALRFVQAHHPALASLPTDRGASFGASTLTAQWRRLACSITFKLDYWQKEGLPDALRTFAAPLNALDAMGLLGRHKFLAYRLWFKQHLAKHAQQVLMDPRTRAMPYWNAGELTKVAADHVTGRKNRLRDLHAVLTLEAVQRTLLDASAWVEREATHPNLHEHVQAKTLRVREDPAWTR